MARPDRRARRYGRERRDGRDGMILALVIMLLLMAPSLPFLPLQPILPFLPLLPSVAAQQRPAADTMARRINERIRTLQAEADRLASQARTLLGDLRQLELQRDIATEKMKAADAAVAQAQLALKQTTDRLTALEQQRESQLPDL